MVAAPLSAGAAGTINVTGNTTFQGVSSTSPSSWNFNGNVFLASGSAFAPTGSSFVVSGNIAVEAGTTFAPPTNSNVNGSVSVAPGGSFAPGNNDTFSGGVTIAAGATLQPAGVGATGAFNVTGLQSAGTLNVDLLGTTAGTQYDQIDLTSGSANITGTTLNLTTSGTLTVGETFTLISNSTGQPVVGQFANGATLHSINNPGQIFTVSYAGGSGNDVVLTLSSIAAGNVLTVDNGGAVEYGGGAGLSNNLTIGLTSGVYSFTDTSGPITLTPAAVTAGWSGSGTQTVTGPAASVSSLLVNGNDGNDTVTLSGLAVPFTINGGGQAGDSVVLAGSLVFTGNASITGVNSVTAMPGADIVSPTGTLAIAAAGGIGNSTNRVDAQVGTETISAGGNVFLAEDSGVSLTATLTSGNLDVLSAAGTLDIVGATSTNGGSINLSSAGAIALDANLNAGSGTINLAADTAGVVLSAAVGNSTAAAITIVGPLSGTGNIVEGTGAVVVTQSGVSTYAGVISGTHPVTFGGTGTLTLAGTNTYTGATNVSGETLLVTGSLVLLLRRSPSHRRPRSWAASGSVGAVSSQGIIAPGSTTPGTLTTGNLTLGAGTLTVDLPSHSAYDSVSAAAANLTGATLNVVLRRASASAITFTILASPASLSRPAASPTLPTIGFDLRGRLGHALDQLRRRRRQRRRAHRRLRRYRPVDRQHGPQRRARLHRQHAGHAPTLDGRERRLLVQPGRQPVDVELLADRHQRHHLSAERGAHVIRRRHGLDRDLHRHGRQQRDAFDRRRRIRSDAERHSGSGGEHLRLLPAARRHGRQRHGRLGRLLDLHLVVPACDDRPGVPGSRRLRRQQHRRLGRLLDLRVELPALAAEH